MSNVSFQRSREKFKDFMDLLRYSMNRRQGMLYHRNNFMENEKLRDNLTHMLHLFIQELWRMKSIALDGVYPKILFLIPIMLTQTLCHTFCKFYYGETSNLSPSTLKKLKVSKRKFVFTCSLTTQVTWLEK